MGANHPEAGKFCVQLDSDDVYADENTLTKMLMPRWQIRHD